MDICLTKIISSNEINSTLDAMSIPVRAATAIKLSSLTMTVNAAVQLDKNPSKSYN
jgi:hypothetical protein